MLRKTVLILIFIFMEQKNYYSERQLNLTDLARDLEPMFRAYFALNYGLKVKRTSIAPVIDLSDACLAFNTSGQLALMWTWNVTEYEGERNKRRKQVWTLFFISELRVRVVLSTPYVQYIGADEEIYQENRFMYAKVKNQEWSVGLIEQTEPVLSKFDALKFILAHKFVEEGCNSLVMSPLISVDLAEKDNHLFWAVDQGAAFYEVNSKAQELKISPKGVSYYSYPESLGKKDYAGKEAFWHFDGGKLHESKGEYLSDKEACKIYPQRIWKEAPLEHPLPLVEAHSEGIERFWLVAKSGPMNFIVSAHTGMLYIGDECFDEDFVPADPSKDEGFIFE